MEGKLLSREKKGGRTLYRACVDGERHIAWWEKDGEVKLCYIRRCECTPAELITIPDELIIPLAEGMKP